MPNLNVKLLVRNRFEDMIVDAFSTKESTNMLIKPSLVIKFKGGLDSINLKEN